uniref:Putative DnaT-like domain-containing protein n=1 Tax=Caulobacter phage BL57 TaxID=3348355 RepID=A0AB74UKF3_9VIRU
MAFSFIVETGAGDPAANSYCDVQFADDYIYANVYASTPWEALEDEDKERFLVRASKYLDRTVDWNGTKVEEDSGLRWPRAGVTDVDGFMIRDDVIPPQLMEATAELAAALVANDWTSPQTTRGMREIQVDVIELKFDSEIQRGSMPDIVMQILEGLGVVKTGTKPAFKKIIRH